MWTRRTFLHAAGAGFAMGLAPRSAEALAGAELVFAAAIKQQSGAFGVALVNENGAVISHLELPDRGHDVTQCPVTGNLVAFARRPGTFALVFSPRGEALHMLSSVEGRHFFGHGVFSPDGKFLYTTENDFDAARGVIGIYETANEFARIGEFASGGMDPHDVLLIDGKLCIANGGIETHPEYGRQKLNLSTMAPNLTWIDPQTGNVLAKHSLPNDLHQVSLRHLARGQKNQVWIGGQYQGNAKDEVPLLMRSAWDEDLVIPDLPQESLRALSHYVGSVGASADGQTIVATSPVGDAAVIYDTVTGRSETRSLANVCGVDVHASQPILSTGDGMVSFEGQQKQSEVYFDNHLMILRS